MNCTAVWNINVKTKTVKKKRFISKQISQYPSGEISRVIIYTGYFKKMFATKSIKFMTRTYKYFMKKNIHNNFSNEDGSFTRYKYF